MSPHAKAAATAACSAMLVVAAISMAREPRAARSRQEREQFVERGFTAPQLDRAALPGSLRGTEPDGETTVDAAGHLIRNPALRRFLDYFLTAEGEQTTTQLREAALRAARLDNPARDELAALFDRYAAMRERALTERPRDVSRFRAEALGEATARALFPTADEAALRETRLAVTGPARLDAEEDAMRAAGATAADLTAVRTQVSGADAAARLGELDRDRARFQAALAEFDRRLPGADARALLDELFSAPEQRRVRALRGLPPD